MVQSVIDNLAFLKALVRASRYKRRSLLSLAKTKQLLCLKEICRNLKGNIPMPEEVFEKITKGGYKPYIRLCGDKNTNLHTTRCALVKRGGFIPFVLPAIIRFAQNYMMTAPNKRHRLFKHSHQYSSLGKDGDLESSDTQSSTDTMSTGKDDETDEIGRDSSESDHYSKESNIDSENDVSDESSRHSSEFYNENDESDESNCSTWNKLSDRRRNTRKKNMSSVQTGMSNQPSIYGFGNLRQSNYRPDVDQEEVDQFVKFLTRQNQ